MTRRHLKGMKSVRLADCTGMSMPSQEQLAIDPNFQAIINNLIEYTIPNDTGFDEK